MCLLYLLHLISLFTRTGRKFLSVINYTCLVLHRSCSECFTITAIENTFPIEYGVSYINEITEMILLHNIAMILHVLDLSTCS